jgi:hypothetical protein
MKENFESATKKNVEKSITENYKNAKTAFNVELIMTI